MPRARDAALGSIKARIADRLRQAIQDGDYRPGAALPSTAALAASEEAAPMTVRAAYEQLISEGQVVAVPRKGYFVRDQLRLDWDMNAWQDPERVATLPVDTWIATVEGAGFLHRQTINLAIVGPDHQLGRRTVGELLQTTDPVVVRQRVRYIGRKIANEPESIADSYYPQDLVAGSKIMSPESHNTVAELHEMGADLARYIDELTPRIATPAEADQLQLPTATAVLELVRLGITSDNRPVLVQHQIRPGNGSRFVYHVAYPERG